MAPYHALDNQAGSPKPRPPALSVRKDSPNAPPRRDWQAGGSGTDTGTPPKPAGAPTIRVIHIFAPKVIKTDMANFRSTVQKLTGRSPKKSSRASRTKLAQTEGVLSPAAVTLPLPLPTMESAYPPSLTNPWDQQQNEVLHRLVGDACGGTMSPLERSSSVESSTYSFSSDSTEKTSSDLASPTDASFSFYVPQHRESGAYSLSEIPAPFFGADMHPTSFPSASLPLQLPSPVMESMLGGFDVDSLGSGLGSPLQLSDVAAGLDVAPYASVLGSGSSGGGLYDMVAPQHCRLSVQQPNFQGGNFFEMI